MSNIIVSAGGGKKGAKPSQIHTVPAEALLLLGEAAKYGGDVYGDYNFRRGINWSLFYDAMHRHQNWFWAGQNLDPESGLPHMVHAAWHALMLTFFQVAEDGDRYHQFDDRPWVYDLRAMIQGAMKDASPTT